MLFQDLIEAICLANRLPRNEVEVVRPEPLGEQNMNLLIVSVSASLLALNANAQSAAATLNCKFSVTEGQVGSAKAQFSLSPNQFDRYSSWEARISDPRFGMSYVAFVRSNLDGNIFYAAIEDDHKVITRLQIRKNASPEVELAGRTETALLEVECR